LKLRFPRIDFAAMTFDHLAFVGDVQALQLLSIGGEDASMLLAGEPIAFGRSH